MRTALFEDDDEEYGDDSLDPANTFGMYSSEPGVPFLRTQPFFASIFPNARLSVEAVPYSSLRNTPIAQWNWIDVTTDVQVDNNQFIEISPMGAIDWQSSTSPAVCQFSIDNRRFLYGPWLPDSVADLNWHKGMPIRVSIWPNGRAGTRYTRYLGYVRSLTVVADSTGGYQVVKVRCAGTLQRSGLGASATPLRSPLYREAMNSQYASTRLAYWSLEDPSGSASMVSSVPVIPALTITGTPTLATYTGAVGSGALPTLTAGSWFSGFTPGLANNGDAHWRFFFSPPAAGVSGTQEVMAFWTGGSAALLRVFITNAGVMNLAVYATDGTTQLGTTSTISPAANGAKNFVYVDAANSGTSLKISLIVTTQTSASTWATLSTNTTVALCNVGAVQSVTLGWNGGMTGTTYGHLALGTGTFAVGNGTSPFMANGTWAMIAYVGETAAARFTRICLEESINQVQYQNASMPVTMGAQSSDTLVNVLREIESASFGLLGDGLNEGLYLAHGSVLYNENANFTVSATATFGPLVTPEGSMFEATDDDQYLVNRVTVTRKNGAAVTYDSPDPVLGSPTASNSNIDVYPGGPSGTISLASDAAALNYAGWYARLSTVNDFRYPSMDFDWSKASANQITGFLSAIPGGTQWSLTNLGAFAGQYPTQDLPMVLRGWSERLNQMQWLSTLNSSSGLPWIAGPSLNIVAPVTFSRLDVTSSTVTQDAPAGATTIRVSTPSGNALWAASASLSGSFPMYLNVGGQAILATASSITSSTTQSFTVDSTTVKLPVLTGQTVRLWRAGALPFSS